MTRSGREACGAGSDRSDIPGIGFRIALEHGGAGDQRIGAGLDHQRRRLRGDAAVDFDIDIASRNEIARFADLVDHRGNEALAAKAWIDRHDEDEVEPVQYMPDVIDGRSGIERDAGLLAERLHGLQRAVEMGTRLGMNRDGVGAGLGESFEIAVDWRDHQMDVKGFPRHWPDRGHHHRAEADIGHEMPIHHVDMYPVGARLIDGAHLIAEPGEIGGEDRGRDTKRADHVRYACRMPQRCRPCGWRSPIHYHTRQGRAPACRPSPWSGPYGRLPNWNCG